VDTNWDEVVESFDDMGLRDDLLRGIYAYGFEKPSAIQQRGIMPILKTHDTIAQAQSGTGKTATFTISVLQSIDLKIRDTQALILAPTRELAQQIQKVVRAIGDYLKVTSHACVGGTLVRDDVKILRDGVQVSARCARHCHRHLRSRGASVAASAKAQRRGLGDTGPRVSDHRAGR
jgi:translation initiation factor 4A